MSQEGLRKSVKDISPIDVYTRLPKTNCGDCGERNCMAFAAKVVNRRIAIEACTPLLESEFEKQYNEIKEIMAPAVKEITIGTGENSVKIGGKLILYRHEFTYHNPPPIAVDVNDEMLEDELLKKVKAVEDFTYTYIGKEVTLDMIAVRSTSNDPTSFRITVERVSKATNMPLILCSFDPSVMEAGLVAAKKNRPLIYAATSDNWKEMAELALMYDCPLTVFAPNDLNLLRSLTKTLLEYGVEDLVLDPGTFTDEGISETMNNFTMIRRNATKDMDSLMGYPLVGTPLTAWIGEDAPEEVLAWKEAYTASMLISRYADILITHSIDGWVQLPLVIWRFNLYTDPRKPVAVDPGLRILGEPDENSPVMLTANYALTYFTVESDIKSGDINSYLLVADTEGMSVESGVAGRYLTAEKIADTIKTTEIEEKVNHKNIIIPGMAARLSGEAEELSGWNVMVGPRDSSGIPGFLKEKWPPKK